MVPKRVLVTGLSGFFGEHFAKHMQQGGIYVTGSYRTHAVQLDKVDARRIDLTDPEQVLAWVEETQPDAVVHAAAQTDVAFCQTHPVEARRSIVDATRAVVDAVQRHRPTIPFVLLSTDLVYEGNGGTGSQGYCVDDPARPISVYGECKIEAESAALTLASGCVVRSALIYGAPTTHKSGVLGWMVRSLAQDRPITLFEDEWRTPIFVEDLCFAVTRCATNGTRGVWLAGGQDRMNRLQMGEIVCECFGFSKSLLIRSRLQDSNYAAPRPANVALDSTSLWNRLGHRPRSFREGVTLARDAMFNRPI